MKTNSFIYIVLSILLFISSPLVIADRPFDMAKDIPTPVFPGAHAFDAHVANLDTHGAASGVNNLILDLPDGSTVELQRDGYKNRGKGKGKGLEKNKNAVWLGRAVGFPDSRAVLTIQDGIMIGRLRINEDIYEIRVLANPEEYGLEADTQQNYLVEKLDLNSFPENDEDSVYLPENDAFIDEDADSGILTDPDLLNIPDVASDGPIIIDLMSLYTPTTRIAAGGVANIEATIQAAVDVSNAAFSDSGMNVRYRLVYVAESAYDESSTSITADLSWVLNDNNVKSLRDEYGADMVSLFIEDGGSSCGIGYVQRTPGASFAPYAYQVTDRGCAVGNLTFAHEHGHNMGMEHNPENSSASSSQASYDWSFGHYIYGSYRTIMTYSSVCGYCTRVGRFSNPDVSYLGKLTGVVNQRDNAYTGELTAPIVAAFRPTMVPIINAIPEFINDPIYLANIDYDVEISDSLAGSALDSDGDTLVYSIVSGPSWLNVATNGDLTGTPDISDQGMNSFEIEVTDGKDTASTTLFIEVTPPASAITSEIIIDNNDVNTSSTGIWSLTGPAAVNTWDVDALWSDGGNATFRWNANITQTGTYTVYAWWTYWSNRSTAAPFSIQHSAGTDTVIVNQRDPSLDGKWVYLGEYHFTAGSAAFVELSSGTGEFGRTTADAVRFVSTSTVASNPPVNNAPAFTQTLIDITGAVVAQELTFNLASYASDADGDNLTFSKISGPAWLTVASNGTLSGIPAANDEGSNSFTIQVSDGQDSDSTTVTIDVSPASISAEIIIDNNDVNTSSTGIWSLTGPAAVNIWDVDALWSDGGNATFRWNANITQTGNYSVYAWWTYWSNRSTAAPFSIQHSAGTDTVIVNQRDPSLDGKWVYLGEYHFTAGSAAFVELSSGTGEFGRTTADAVKFVSAM